MGVVRSASLGRQQKRTFHRRVSFDERQHWDYLMVLQETLATSARLYTICFLHGPKWVAFCGGFEEKSELPSPPPLNHLSSKFGNVVPSTAPERARAVGVATRHKHWQHTVLFSDVSRRCNVQACGCCPYVCVAKCSAIDGAGMRLCSSTVRATVVLKSAITVVAYTCQSLFFCRTHTMHAMVVAHQLPCCVLLLRAGCYENSLIP